MTYLNDYLKKYRDITFAEEKLNDIDIAIFTQLTYIDYIEGFNTTLNEYLETSLKNKNLLKNNIKKEDLIESIKLIIDSNRYKDILIKNPTYILKKDEQFGAFTLILSDNTKIICFEGTDHNMVGWEEDFKLSYQFPVPAQTDAIKYLNDNISLFDKNVIVCGHSKGGNLALVGSMFTSIFKRNKIKQIYSFDGPGLRKREIESKRFKKTEKKYKHFICNQSMIGLLLRHTNKHMVIKSSKRGMLAHSLYYWQINDKYFLISELSESSKKFDNNVLKWLEGHNDEERKKLVNNMFKAFNNLGIERITDSIKLKNTIKIVKEMKNLDESSKDLLVDFIKYNIKHYFKDNS
jgi:hypothetical protein